MDEEGPDGPRTVRAQDGDLVEQALIRILARVESGEVVTAAEIRESYPDCWEQIRDVLTLEVRFRDLHTESSPPADEGGAGAARLREPDEDRYERFRVLGRGGMGIVYRALDADLGREVAFKVVRPGPAEGAPAAPGEVLPPDAGTPARHDFDLRGSRFLREARITAQLEHPGIVPVYEVGRTAHGVPYYTMRFVRGNRTLAAAIDAARGLPFDARLALLEPFLRVCDTIRYAHAHGVLHRDLKPENVALGEYGEVVVLDWGLARVRGAAAGAGAGGAGGAARRAVGTPGYMSPEAAEGREDLVDERSDVHSLGAILYEIAARRPPYAARSAAEVAAAARAGPPPAPRTLDPEVPEALSAICARAVAVDREARQPSVDALAAEVRGWLDERARDLEIEGLRREASAARAAVEGLEGDALLRQLDRVRTAAEQILARRDGDARATALLAEVGRLRDEGIRRRELAARGAAVRRAGLAFLAVALAGGAVAAWAIRSERAETVVEREAKEREREQRRCLALTLRSAEEQVMNPRLALRLAREAVLAHGDPAAVNRLRAALGACHERAELRLPGVPIVSAVFAADGSAVVTLAGGAVQVWTPDGALTTVARVAGAWIDSAAVSSDGSLLLTTSDDGAARVWRIRGAGVVGDPRTLRIPGAAVTHAAFSPSGDRVLVVTEDGAVRVWDPGAAELPPPLPSSAPVTEARFSASGGRVLALTSGGAVRLWDLALGSATEFVPESGRARLVACSPGEDAALTVSEDGAAELWSLAGDLLARVAPSRAAPRSACFAPDGTRILLVLDDGTALLWTPAEGRTLRLADDDGAIVAAVFRPGSDGIVTGSEHGTLRLWDLDAHVREAFGVRHAARVTCEIFSPHGGRLVTACAAGVGRVWDPDGRLVAELRGHTDRIESASFSAREDLAVTVSADGTARVWRVSQFEPVTLPGAQGVFGDEAFDPAGEEFVTTPSDGTVFRWSFDGGDLGVLRPPMGSWSAASLGAGRGILVGGCGPLLALGPHGEDLWVAPAGSAPSRLVAVSARRDLVLSVEGRGAAQVARLRRSDGRELGAIEVGDLDHAAIVPEADLVLLWADGTRARLWRVAEKRVESIGEGTCLAAAFTPRGGFVVLASDDEARLVDPAGHAVGPPFLHRNKVSAAAISPQGDRVVTAGWDRRLRLRDLTTGTERVLTGHTDRVTTVVWAPAGNLFATAGQDGTVRIWGRDGDSLGVLAVAGAEAADLAISPRGDRLLTADADGRVRIWRLPVADLLGCAGALLPGDFTLEERENYGELLGPRRASAAPAPPPPREVVAPAAR